MTYERPKPHPFRETLFDGDTCGFPKCGLLRSSPVHTDRPVLPLSDPDEPHAYVRHDASGTSANAAWVALPRSGTQRRRVGEFIYQAGDYGATDAEIADALGLLLHSVNPRRLELQEGGWIEDSGARRPVVRPNQPQITYAIVWVMTPRGRTEWQSDNGGHGA